MADYMTLLGAEDVHSASRNMLSAADQFASALGSFTYQLDRLQHMLDDHASRIEAAVASLKEKGA
jgi:hypothetical protein